MVDFISGMLQEELDDHERRWCTVYIVSKSYIGRGLCSNLSHMFRQGDDHMAWSLGWDGG